MHAFNGTSSYGCSALLLLLLLLLLLPSTQANAAVNGDGVASHPPTAAQAASHLGAPAPGPLPAPLLLLLLPALFKQKLVSVVSSPAVLVQ